MVSFPESTMVKTNGIDMAVYEAGPKNGFPVVLCHGFPELAYSWRHQLPALAAAGYRAIAPDQRSAFAELARRRGDYALVGLAAHGRVRADRLDDVRLVYFSIGATPVRARTAEALLMGRSLTREAVAAAQAALAAELDPPADTQASSAARLQMARVLLARIVTALRDPVPAGADG